MRQVELRAGGEVAVAEVPAPQLSPGRVLVRTSFSLVSPGTELGLIQRQAVAGETRFPLGYSAAGVVAASDEAGFEVGAPVGCYGAPYTHHAGVLAVPRTLAVPLAPKLDLRQAAFGGLGAVAVHSVRRAQLEFGEVCVVVGLGVLGNMIAQVAAAAGFQVIATDPVPARREAAAKLGIIALPTDHAAVKAEVAALTEGRGADAVLVCAGGDAAPFLDQAIDLLRLRGRAVIVGNVPGRFDRELQFQKEADIVIARAGGPGRYDPSYEASGVDYPAGYVRWTEGRNLAEFLRLVTTGRVDVASLITHEFALGEAPEAYRTMQDPGAGALGVLLRYE